MTANAVTADPDSFAAQLQQQRGDIVASLPRPEDEKRFISTLHMAVATRPDLLEADRLSFWRAVRQSATDGLKPDGKEGVINAYYDKFLKKKMCVWVPMTLGLRKRAIELASVYIDAEVVHENDHFRVVRGDDPKIEHWETRGKPRGKMTEAYAIFRKLMPDGSLVIVHREVMDQALIAAVKSKASAPGGMMWQDFEGEAWRKTVVRRGIKSVPAVSDSLMAIFQRDDQLYDFSSKPVAGALGPAIMPPAIASANAPAPSREGNAALPATGSAMMPPSINSASAQAATPPPSDAPQKQPAEGAQAEPDNPLARYFARLESELKKARSCGQVQAIFDRQEKTIEGDRFTPDDRQRAYDLIDNYMARFDAQNEAA